MDIVVAVYENWGIGLNGSQPVVVKADRRHFREVTGTGTVILGRKTLEDFPGGKPLKGRRNIILTRDAEFTVEGGEVVHSVDEAVRAVEGEDPDQVFVIGGESVYRQLMPYCRRAFVTKIYDEPPADAFFPDLDELEEWHAADTGPVMTEEDIKYQFITYERKE